MNQTQPSPRFSDFLQANAELVNEILARFCALQLPMIRERRSSAAQQLIRDVSPRRRRRQRINQPNDPNRIFQQPLLQIKVFFARQSPRVPLLVGRWTLDVGRWTFCLSSSRRSPHGSPHASAPSTRPFLFFISTSASASKSRCTENHPPSPAAGPGYPKTGSVFAR